jgi:hypothetical protein
MLFTWNLKPVTHDNKCEICEVLYDDKGRPALYTNARLIDRIKYIKDWWGKKPLLWPDDFVGELWVGENEGFCFMKATE